MLEAGKGLGRAFVAIKPTKPGADPERPGTVFHYGSNRIVAQAGRVRQRVLEDLHLIAVIAVQPVQGAKPEKALAVAQNALDICTGKPLFGGDTHDAIGDVVVRRCNRLCLRQHRARLDKGRGWRGDALAPGMTGDSQCTEQDRNA